MKYGKQILTLIALSMLAALVACSSGSSSNTNPPPPTTTIAATSGSSQTATSGTAFAAPLVATVTKGGSPVSGASVTFTAPSSGASGTFSNNTATETDTTDANGKATSTTFTANTTAGAYAVTATVSGASTPASFSLTNSAPALADGSYVFSLTGYDASTGGPNSYSVSGVFTVKTGAITAGEQDFVDAITTDQHDMINPTGSSISAPNGNLVITLVTCLAQDCTKTDTAVGGGTGSETIHATLISAAQARIIEDDAFATSSGTLVSQDTTAAAVTPADGGYAFAAQGNPGTQRAIGGILNVSGSSNSGASISPTGTVFDLNSGLTVSQAQTISVGSVSAPDSMGRLQVSLTPTDTTLPIFNFVAYIVDSNQIRLAGATLPLSGVAYAQSATNLSAAGTSYVVGMVGVHKFLPFQVAGILAMGTLSGATGPVTGTLSYNDSLNAQAAATSITAGAIYTPDPANAGRNTLTTVAVGSFTFNTIELYIDGNGHALAISLDPNQDVLEGIGYQQNGAVDISNRYVMSATGADTTNDYELDGVGAVTIGSSNDFASASSGVDLNWLSTATAAVQSSITVSGTYTPGTGGVSTGTGNTITGLDVAKPANVDAFDYYAADSKHIFAIETDSNQLTLVLFEQ